MESDRSFKVIIAGGSVVGLALANALEKAGIDFVVLEKGDVAPQLGASISIYPHTAKVFDQLGVWNSMMQATLPLTDRLHFDQYGRLFEDSQVLRILEEKTTRPTIFPARNTYIKVLYDNLEAKSKAKVREHVGLVSWTEDDDGITVHTTTGEEVRGSILVGADGIHSAVRKLMAEGVAESDPQRAKNLIEGFTSYYRVVFGMSKNQHKDDPSRPLVKDTIVENVYYKGVSGLGVVGVSGQCFFFLYVKEDRPSTTPNCPRYTESDADDTLRKYGHLQVGPGFTFQDLWDQRIKGGMVPMEEGVIEGSWNNGGRVVLLGDSAAKSTISAGLGGNTNVEGVCHLVNELRPVLGDLKEAKDPGKEKLQMVFDRYEAKQRPRANACVTLSSYLTKYEGMETWWLRLLRYISPWISDNLKAKGYMYFFSGAPTLDFLPDPDKKTK